MTVTTDPNAEGAAIALAGDPIIPPGGPKGGTPIGLGIPGIPIGGKGGRNPGGGGKGRLPGIPAPGKGGIGAPGKGGKGGAIPGGGMNMGGLRERFTSGMSIPTIAGWWSWTTYPAGIMLGGGILRAHQCRSSVDDPKIAAVWTR